MEKGFEANKNTQCLLSLPQSYQTRRLIFTHDLKETLFSKGKGEDGRPEETKEKTALDCLPSKHNPLTKHFFITILSKKVPRIDCQGKPPHHDSRMKSILSHV